METTEWSADQAGQALLGQVTAQEGAARGDSPWSVNGVLPSFPQPIPITAST